MAALVAAAPTPAPAVPAERRRDLPSSPAFRASSQVGMVVEEAARPSVSPNMESEVTWLTSPPYLQLERSCRSDRPVRSCYWRGQWEERGRPGRRARGSRGGQRRPAQTRQLRMSPRHIELLTVTFMVEDWCFDWSWWDQSGHILPIAGLYLLSQPRHNRPGWWWGLLPLSAGAFLPTVTHFLLLEIFKPCWPPSAQ